MQQRTAAALHACDLLCAAPHIPAPHACPPPIPPGIARATCHPPGWAPPAVRATEARLPRSWLPWPRRSRPRSRSLPSDAAVWLSYAVSGGAVLYRWPYDQLLLVGTLVLWYVHHFPPLACNHMTIPGLYSTPPLNPSIRPYLSPTYEPLRPDLFAIWVAGDVAGSIPRLLREPDTLNTSICGSAGAQ